MAGSFKEKQTPSGLEYESDYWVYNNEMPMNGGLFGNIVGYENMGESFSLFYKFDCECKFFN